ncbi:hypothetical protein E2562_025989 [Oryza meyeriana var. granulata]|uniref:Uncharacterized protein n=1 Tax=Oryza meyeriana var. granulata TaxID=110450 RepID=A0A6G1EPF2_9ORYZ|nr:hypothetical protein E2562_025989 [Oryza meyeriana var. granulata]
MLLNKKTERSTLPEENELLMWNLLCLFLLSLRLLLSPEEGDSRLLHVSPIADVAKSSPLIVSPYSAEAAEGLESSPSSYMSSPYQSDPNDPD